MNKYQLAEKEFNKNLENSMKYEIDYDYLKKLEHNYLKKKKRNMFLKRIHLLKQ